MDLIPGTQVPAKPAAKTCICGKTTLCNLTDCPLPWAVAYRRSVRIRWWERPVGWLFVWGMWRQQRRRK